jgi:hypothetical protein
VPEATRGFMIQPLRKFQGLSLDDLGLGLHLILLVSRTLTQLSTCVLSVSYAWILTRDTSVHALWILSEAHHFLARKGSPCPIK